MSTRASWSGAWASPRPHVGQHRRRKPQPEHPLESAIGSERAALDLVSWVARSEPDRDRQTAYLRQAWLHLAHLQRFAELSDRAGHPWAERVGGEIDELTAGGFHRAGTRRPAAVRFTVSVDDATGVVTAQLGGRSEPAAARTAVGHRPRRLGQLVVHESTACYLYYSFMGQETDRRLRQLWELYLQMELAHLRAAGDLLRRHTGCDPQEVVGPGFPEPVALASSALLLWDLANEAGARPAGAPGVKPDGEWDVVDRLTEQHDRIEHQFRHTLRVTGDARHTAFGRLAR